MLGFEDASREDPLYPVGCGLNVPEVKGAHGDDNTMDIAEMFTPPRVHFAGRVARNLDS